MRIELMCNQNTFQILKAEGCPAEYKASNGWRVYQNDAAISYSVYTIDKSVNILGERCDIGCDYIDPLTALHEMVYQPKFSDVDGVVTLEHGTFWIVERPGGQVCFQVLEMDEEFRGESYGTVTTSAIPCVSEQFIFLRGGDKSRDFNVDSNCGQSRDQIISALRDWDQNWSGWTRKTPTLADCCKHGTVKTGGVFVFESEVK